MPYTAYISTAAYSVCFGSVPAAWFVVGMVGNEVLNHKIKALVKKIAGPTGTWARRPKGAMDTGIYPHHYPTLSTTQGMPSGHCQTSGFIATVFISHILQDTVSGRSPVAKLCSSAFVFAIAVAMCLSRTRYGGRLCVHVNGEIKPPHTPLQAVAGACIGVLCGLAASSWYYSN
eukprot:CAMPEP_0184514064 /NCGR_PEP_ID=MMETSP0198_2-20121128/3763_2 /TAXON_ID=1112570 /ORGANISM="Thraustochytrium sp., Strain LLF1b" /LENGTH=173 /DNA_ID=CAMNT_0026904227 /DNA_START=241 /DNA_END=762 /DNA_ORIENTATION=-